MDRSVLVSRLRAFGIAVGIAVLTIGVTRLVISALGALFVVGSVTLPRWLSLVFSIFVQDGIVFVGIAAGYLRLRGLGLGWLGISVPDLEDAMWIAAGWVGAFFVVFVLTIVLFVLGVQPGQNQIQGVIVEDPELIPLLIPLMIVLVGPAEELVFRGLVQGTLRERFGPVAAITLASIIFASIHFGSLTGPVGSRVLTIGLLVIPSLIFGAIYERTNNLVVPALVHGLYNATLFALQYVALKSGANPPSMLF